MNADHWINEYGTTNCPVEGVRANVDDGECSACGAAVAPAEHFIDVNGRCAACDPYPTAAASPVSEGERK